MATRKYSLIPSRLHPTIRVFVPDASNPIQFPRDSVREIRVTTSVSESKVDYTLRSIYVNNILTGGDENALETARIAWLGMTSHIPDDYTLVEICSNRSLLGILRATIGPLSSSG